MFDLVPWAFVVLLLLVVLVGLCMRNPVVAVSSTTTLPFEPDAVDRLARWPLSQIRRARVVQPFAGFHVVTTSWVPNWTVVVAVLAFPMGLIAMFVARDSAALYIRVSGHENGTLVEVTGHSRRSVALAVGRVFVEMGAPAFAPLSR